MATREASDFVEPDPPSPVGRPGRVSLRRNFGWAFMGNAVYQACQWLMLVALAKLTTAEEVGRFALALAICTPITVAASLQLRAVQITDVRDEFLFGHFLAARMLAASAALLIILGVTIAAGYGLTTSALILLVGVGQLVLSVREVFTSYLQKHERMNWVAASQAATGISSVILLAVLVWTTGSLLIGVAGMTVGRLAGLFGWDLIVTRRVMAGVTEGGTEGSFAPRWSARAVRTVLWTGLPLGIMAVLTNLVENVPRYVIEVFLDREALGFFAAIAALPMALRMVVQAAGVSAVPRLSRYYLTDRRAWLRLTLKLGGVGLVLGIAGLVVSFTVGEWLLDAMFTREYARHVGLFRWLMVYGLVAYVVASVGYGVQATRWFWLQPPLFVAVLAVTAATAWVLVPRYELVGGALCMIMGRCAQLMLVVGVIGWLYFALPLPMTASSRLSTQMQSSKAI